MIKSEAPLMQDLHQTSEVPVADDRREGLARKGQVLYGKYCGTAGRGICAESFAEYHIWRGEYSVARDLLVFLAEQVDVLQQTAATDTATVEQVAQLAMTEQLIGRIQALLGAEVAAEPLAFAQG